jgi:hypothetical protein
VLAFNPSLSTFIRSPNAVNKSACIWCRFAMERQNLKIQTVQNKNPLESLTHDYRIAAKIVELYGDKYIPGFVRVHEEIQKHSALNDAKNLALKVAKSYSSF